MRKRVTIFFLTTALILVFGHSVLPHNHTDGVRRYPYVSLRKTLTFYEIIRNSLSQNLGTNHLEEFRIQHSVKLSFQSGGDALAISRVQVFLPEVYYTTNIFSSERIFRSQHFCLCDGSRPPPFRV